MLKSHFSRTLGVLIPVSIFIQGFDLVLVFAHHFSNTFTRNVSLHGNEKVEMIVIMLFDSNLHYT